MGALPDHIAAARLAAVELRIVQFKIEAARMLEMHDRDAAEALLARKREWGDFVMRFQAEVAAIDASIDPHCMESEPWL